MAIRLTEHQHDAMIYTERVGAAISTLAICFIIFTYLFASGFCKPINRLIFYTSWGNLGVCLVAFISEDGPDAGQNSPLCQAQAFLVQVFLGVDTWWAFCMAVNIYLVFFRNWSTRQLRGLDHKYFIACYGISIIPAIFLLFVETKERGKVYGHAILWCWIGSNWAFLRIAVLYGFMWIAVLIAAVIYIMAGIQVWKKRAALDGFFNPWNENPFTHVLTTTEVSITSENREILERRKDSEPHTEVRMIGHHEDGYDPYSVNIEIGRPQRPRRPSRPTVFRIPAVTREVALSEDNAEAFLYARVAFLFFVALLITWVPSSINRAYAVAHRNHIDFGLNLSSAVVFSIQGFLNCIVYMMSSQTACRDLWRTLFTRRKNIINGRHASESLGVNKPARSSKRDQRQRLDSDATSITNLTIV